MQATSAAVLSASSFISRDTRLPLSTLLLPLIEQLNTQHEYPVRILYKEGYEESMVKTFPALTARDPEAIADAIAEADVMATAVGVNILKFIFEMLPGT